MNIAKLLNSFSKFLETKTANVLFMCLILYLILIESHNSLNMMYLLTFYFSLEIGYILSMNFLSKKWKEPVKYMFTPLNFGVFMYYVALKLFGY